MLGEPDLQAKDPWARSPRVYYTDSKIDPKNALPEGKGIDHFREWWFEKDAARIAVRFNAEGTALEYVSCLEFTDETMRSSCPPMLGVEIGDSEEQLERSLGKPSRQEIGGPTKTVLYDDLGVTVFYCSGSICIRTPSCYRNRI